MTQVVEWLEGLAQSPLMRQSGGFGHMEAVLAGEQVGSHSRLS